MQVIKIRQLIIDALEDVKAIDVTSIDVTGLTDFTDYMVFASGTSNRHVKALAGNVLADAKERGLKPIGVEGMEQGEWILIDLADVVVHVMLPATREFYDIERLWSLRPTEKKSTVLKH